MKPDRPPISMAGLPENYRAIITAVSGVFRVPADEILNRCLERDAAYARMAIIMILRDQGEQFPVIGSRFGRRSSSACKANKTGRTLITTDSFFARRVKAVLQVLSAPQPAAA